MQMEEDDHDQSATAAGLEDEGLELELEESEEDDERTERVEIKVHPPLEVHQRVPLSPPPMDQSGTRGAGEEEEVPLDPRIQGELERLNKSSSEINKMENELDEAKQLFNTSRGRQLQRLEFLQKKFGSCIAKSKPHYDCLAQIERLKAESRLSVKEFERANSLYKKAKETLAVAEANLMANSSSSSSSNNPSTTSSNSSSSSSCSSNSNSSSSSSSSTSCPGVWQEHLSSTITKINASKRNLDLAEDNHRHRTACFQQAEQRGQTLEKELRKQIVKSKSYYDEKTRWNVQMEAQKLRIDELDLAIQHAKVVYNGAMANLSRISEEIHEQRRVDREKEPKNSKNLPPIESVSSRVDGGEYPVKNDQQPQQQQPLSSSKKSENEPTSTKLLNEPIFNKQQQQKEQKKIQKHIQPNSVSLDPSTLSSSHYHHHNHHHNQWK